MSSDLSATLAEVERKRRPTSASVSCSSIVRFAKGGSSGIGGASYGTSARCFLLFLLPTENNRFRNPMVKERRQEGMSWAELVLRVLRMNESRKKTEQKNLNLSQTRASGSTRCVTWT